MIFLFHHEPLNKASNEKWVTEDGYELTGLERNFFIYYTDNNKELQIDDVSIDDDPKTPTKQRWRTPLKASFTTHQISEYLNREDINIIGTGHTHGIYSINFLHAGIRPKPTIENLNRPSNAKGLQDYEEVLDTKNGHPAFLVTPYGYTIYSTAIETPEDKKKEHNYPYYISNSGVNTNSLKTGEIIWEKE